MTEILIVGAGPAGAALAIHLARMGREVVLLDRAKFPREKACGEGLMPAGVAALERLGVHVEGAAFRGVRYHHAGRVAEGQFRGGVCGAGMRRWNLDAALIAAARSSGAKVLEGVSVDDILWSGTAVQGVVAGGETFQARLTVAADGANSRLRHKFGWDASTASRRYAVRRHYRGEIEPWVQVHLENGCETYVTPLPAGEIQIATLRERGNESGVALPEALRDLRPVGEPLGASPLTVRARQRVTEGCVLLGDAAGTCDPVTGGGMAQALLSAELLAVHIGSGLDVQKFDRAREAMLRNYRWLTAGVLTLAEHPALLRPALAILGKSPRLFTSLLSLAGGRAA